MHYEVSKLNWSKFKFFEESIVYLGKDDTAEHPTASMKLSGPAVATYTREKDKPIKVVCNPITQ